MLLDTFDREPDFTNEAGVKWWLDRDTTRYGLKKGLQGYVVYLTEMPNKFRMYVIADKTGVVFENTSLEAIGVHLDMLALTQKESIL